jgi:hypothetical protein
MTHSEIEQLRRNYEEFRKLSPERRKALEDLDDEVKQDTKNGGHLLKLLTGYNGWLSSLSPFDQERINGKTDPVERARLVKTIREEQQKRQTLASLDQPRRLTLHPKDLDAMVKAVEENFLTAETRNKIPSELAGRDRHLRILKAAQLQLRSTSGAATAGQTLVSMLVDAIPTETTKARVMSHPVGARRRRFLGQLLARSLVNEWRDEIRAVFPAPTAIDEVVTQRIANADPAKRDSQKTQLNSPEGRRMVGVQLALQSDAPQFKELRPVFVWLMGGLLPNPGATRGQPAPPLDDTRTDEAETKAKSAD